MAGYAATMGLFFTKSSITFPIGELVEVDMHSHLVPAIDDGSQNMETSIKLIEGLVSIGYKKIITTPHIKVEFPNTRESIAAPFNQLQSALTEAGIKIPISFASEYMTDQDFSPLVSANNLLKVSGNYLLMETGFLSCPMNFEEDLFQVQRKGILPILAHPERYHYINDLGDYEYFRERSMLFQVNILSFTGYYGDKPKQLAHKLLEAGMVDLLGTDLHNEKQLEGLKDFKVDQKIRKLLEKTAFLNKGL